ncbi:YfiR family protein [Shewanella sp. MEBiC00475]|uniref:YfiR family protein n=1 Tax=Shewanella sp. MEBiC00475 TaxID=2575361 RepID=UPI0010C0091A|nr:YfiR family protein [Shewanella sp. MEBiC00475]
MLTIKRILYGSLITLLLTISQGVIAVEKEYALKAGFLFNFARYGEWHNHSNTATSFTLCSPDNSFINTSRTVLSGRKVNKLPIKNIEVILTESDLTQCDILFITADTLESWQQLNNKRLEDVMIVGETDNFIQQGGHIRFFLSGGKIRFEVSPDRLTLSGITMSSKVLRLGRVVND